MPKFDLQKNAYQRGKIEDQLRALMQKYGRLVKKAAFAKLAEERVEGDPDFWAVQWAFDDLAEIIYDENEWITIEIEGAAWDAWERERQGAGTTCK